MGERGSGIQWRRGEWCSMGERGVVFNGEEGEWCSMGERGMVFNGGEWISFMTKIKVYFNDDVWVGVIAVGFLWPLSAPHIK